MCHNCLRFVGQAPQTDYLTIRIGLSTVGRWPPGEGQGFCGGAEWLNNQFELLGLSSVQVRVLHDRCEPCKESVATCGHRVHCAESVMWTAKHKPHRGPVWLCHLCKFLLASYLDQPSSVFLFVVGREGCMFTVSIWTKLCEPAHQIQGYFWWLCITWISMTTIKYIKDLYSPSARAKAHFLNGLKVL